MIFILYFNKSLVANLSAANCHKPEHMKRPENWALGESALIFDFIIFGLISVFSYLASIYVFI